MLDKMPDLGRYRVNHFVIHDGFSKIVLRKVVMLSLGLGVCHMGIFCNFQKLFYFMIFNKLIFCFIFSQYSCEVQLHECCLK